MPETTVSPPTQLSCPRCVAPVDPDARLCNACGFILDGSVSLWGHMGPASEPALYPRLHKPSVVFGRLVIALVPGSAGLLFLSEAEGPFSTAFGLLLLSAALLLIRKTFRDAVVSRKIAAERSLHEPT